MIAILFAGVGVMSAFSAFICWCCCVVAKRADEQAEAAWQEYAAEYWKGVHRDGGL